jgi:hypothetical protein
MYVTVGTITLSSSHPETFTQSYHAGQLCSMVENFLPNEEMPPLINCMFHFMALREMFGERLWQKLKSSAKFRSRVAIYEKLTYQPGLPKSMIGGNREFMLGYAYNHRRTKLYSSTEMIDDIPKIIQYIRG